MTSNSLNLQLLHNNLQFIKKTYISFVNEYVLLCFILSYAHFCISNDV